MRDKKVVEQSGDATMALPDHTCNMHQVEIFGEVDSGSIDSGSELTISAKQWGGSGSFRALSGGVKSITATGAIYTFEGLFTDLKFEPNSTFTSDTDNPTYSVYYVGWKKGA